MRSLTLAFLMAFLSSVAMAQDSDSAIGNETLTADQAQDKAETTTAADATEPDVYTPPAGYKLKKRGKHMVYCKKDMESGTRFASENCFTETQLRAMEATRVQDNSDFDQSRKICSSQGRCGGS